MRARGGARRCAFCHDGLRAPVTCPRCASALHTLCARELGRCASLGCGGRPAASPGAPRLRVAPSPRAVLALVALACALSLVRLAAPASGATRVEPGSPQPWVVDARPRGLAWRALDVVGHARSIPPPNADAERWIAELLATPDPAHRVLLVEALPAALRRAWSCEPWEREEALARVCDVAMRDPALDVRLAAWRALSGGVREQDVPEWGLPGCCSLCPPATRGRCTEEAHACCTAQLPNDCGPTELGHHLCRGRVGCPRTPPPPPVAQPPDVDANGWPLWAVRVPIPPACGPDERGRHVCPIGRTCATGRALGGRWGGWTLERARAAHAGELPGDAERAEAREPDERQDGR